MSRARKARIVMWCPMIPGILLMFLFLLLGKKHIALWLVGCSIVMVSLIIWTIFWRCPDCGKHLGPGNVNYCPHCGHFLGD